MSSEPPSIDTASSSTSDAIAKFALNPTPMSPDDERLLGLAQGVIEAEIRSVAAQWSAMRAQPEAFLHWLHPFIGWRPPFDGTPEMMLAIRVESILATRMKVRRANGCTSTRFRLNAIPDELAVSTTYFRRRTHVQRNYLQYAALAAVDCIRTTRVHADSVWVLLTSVALPIIYRLAALNVLLGDNDTIPVIQLELRRLCLEAATMLQRNGSDWLRTEIGDALSARLLRRLPDIITARASGQIEQFAADDELEAAWRKTCFPDSPPMFRLSTDPKEPASATEEEDEGKTRFSRPVVHDKKAKTE